MRKGIPELSVVGQLPFVDTFSLGTGSKPDHNMGMDQSMTTYHPVDVLFGGMEMLGRGDNILILNVLRVLPKRRFRLIVDADCGTGL